MTFGLNSYELDVALLVRWKMYNWFLQVEMARFIVSPLLKTEMSETESPEMALGMVISVRPLTLNEEAKVFVDVVLAEPNDVLLNPLLPEFPNALFVLPNALEPEQIGRAHV